MTPGSRIYLLAGGGTGGHVAPGIAVAAELVAAERDAKVLFLCTDRPIDARFLEPTAFGMVAQPIRPIPSRPLDWPGFYLRWRRSLKLADALLRDTSPAAVLGLGGFAAAPAVRRAAARGVATAMLNPDAVPGKANRYLARHVTAIFTQFDQTTEHFPPSVRPAVRPVGCPVRREFLETDPRRGRSALGLRQDRLTLAVMGGSLGAETINQAVVASAGVLADRTGRWQVLHVAGPGKAEPIRQAYAAAGVECVVLEFCDQMGEVYAAADLLIGRAGANTIAELTAAATPAVLMPYPFHADRHQHRNAAALAGVGAAVVVDDVVDPAANADRLRAALMGLLDDEAALRSMGKSAGKLARPHAARQVAQWLMAAK